MRKIIFVCHGNICRSPAAEYIMKSLTNDFVVISRAISTEEIGNDIYPPMKKVLDKNNISYDRHYARKINYQDYIEADYIFYMDDENKYILNHMFPNSNKILPIYKYSPNIKEIEDPWYTGRYDLVFTQIKQCVIDIINNIDK